MLYGGKPDKTWKKPKRKKNEERKLRKRNLFFKWSYTQQCDRALVHRYSMIGCCDVCFVSRLGINIVNLSTDQVYSAIVLLWFRWILVFLSFYIINKWNKDWIEVARMCLGDLGKYTIFFMRLNMDSIKKGI